MTSIPSFLSVTLLWLLWGCSPPATIERNCFPSPFPLKAKTEHIATAPRLPLPTRIKHATALVVVDAGHGGEDYGTHSHSKPVYHEKYLNLSTAQIVKSHLQTLGYQVLMTRTNDIFIPLEKRAEIANQANATLFVSVHYNSAENIKAEGLEVFYYRDPDSKERTEASKKLAQAVLDKIVEKTEAKSRGVKSSNLAVLRHTKMPAILVEGGFLTNEGEMQKIKKPEYIKKIASGVPQGIHDYLNGKK